jgi:26S proteasome regulatory subunit N13
MALNLFAAAQESTKKDGCLLEFKAGKMHMDPNTKMVRAEKRKGLIQLRTEDGMIQFIWKDRVSNQADDPLHIFRDEATFRKVQEANARVYVLEFKDSNRKLFYWLQEPSDEKDEQYCADVNKYINNPPQPGANTDDKTGGLGNLDQNQLLQFLAQQSGGNLSGLRDMLRQQGVGGAGQRRTNATTGSSGNTGGSSSSSGSTATATQSSAGGSAGGRAFNSDALKNIVANLSRDKPIEPQLTDVVNVEEIIKSGILDNEEIVKKLAEYLPEGGPVTFENLKENLNSPQFKEAVRLFNQALKSGELATIAMSFGLDASAMGPNSTIEDFLQAIQKQQKDEEKKEKK